MSMSSNLSLNRYLLQGPYFHEMRTKGLDQVHQQCAYVHTHTYVGTDIDMNIEIGVGIGIDIDIDIGYRCVCVCWLCVVVPHPALDEEFCSCE